MAWTKACSNGQIYYTCTEGSLKGTVIMIRKQDQFEQNRYCSIVLRGDDNVIMGNLYTPIRSACDDVKHTMKSPGLTEEVFTFYVVEGKNQSLAFFNCIKLIDIACPLGTKIREDISNDVGKSFAEIRKNARLISQSVRTGTGFFCNLPDDLNVKIVGLTGSSESHDIKQSEKIGIDHFRGPTK